ncbi:MAG: ABC transporter permease [bacterium]
MSVLGRHLIRSPLGLAGCVVVVMTALTAVFAPFIAPCDPLKPDLVARLKPPMWEDDAGEVHVLGTDQLGRDVLSRIIFGSRVSLLVALGVVPISSILGVSVGLISGYVGGILDDVLMRLGDIQLSLPFMLLVLAVVAAVGPSLRNVILILGIVGWVRYAKLVRGEVLSLREREFILAARSIGAGTGRIVFRHLLPNVMSPAVVLVTLAIPQIIVAEAGLSFLGLGIQPPTPSWGEMLSAGREYIWTAWWLSTFAGIAISIVVLGANMLGDWVRDEMDPRVRRR